MNVTIDISDATNVIKVIGIEVYAKITCVPFTYYVGITKDDSFICCNCSTNVPAHEYISQGIQSKRVWCMNCDKILSVYANDISRISLEVFKKEHRRRRLENIKEEMKRL